MPAAPCHFSKVINVADGAQRVYAGDLYGRKLLMTGYPLTMATNVYVGYDNTVSASNFAFALRGGDVMPDEAQHPGDRRNVGIYWIFVEADATGVMVGLE